MLKKKRDERRHPRLNVEPPVNSSTFAGRFEELALAYAEAYLGRAELERMLSRRAERPERTAPGQIGRTAAVRTG
jgi:hypothetical protein